MKLEHIQEAKTAAYGAKITQLRIQAEEMDATRKLLINELRELERATESGYRKGGIVHKVAVNTKGVSNRFVAKLLDYSADLSAPAFVKLLKALEQALK